MIPAHVNQEIREPDPSGHGSGPQKRYAAVFLACLGLATLMGTVGWNLLQAAPTQPTTPHVNKFGPGSPYAPGGSVYDEQVPAAARSEARVGSATPDGSDSLQQVRPAFTSTGSPTGLPVWVWPVVAGGTVIVAASTALITAAVDRARHPCRLASLPGPAESDLVADLDDPAVDVLESL